MEITQVDKKVIMSQWDMVKFQLITYCYLKRLHLSEHDLSCLTLLSIEGASTLEEFCEKTRARQIFSSNQSARNALSKAEKKGLIIKEGYNKKKVSISPDLNIQAWGNVVLNYKLIHLESKLEPQESQGVTA